MNTLSPTFTGRFYKDKDGYGLLCVHWSKIMNADDKYKLDAAHHLLYLALRGKDWRKGFTPPSNQRKIDNGAFEGWILFSSLARIHSPVWENWLLEPFAGHVTLATLEHLRRFLPKVHAYAFKREQFSGHNFPFYAYNLPIDSQAKQEKEQDSNE